MKQTLFLLLLVIGHLPVFAQNAFPANRRAIRKELKSVVAGSKEPGWSKHIQCIRSKNVPMEWDEDNPMFNRDATIAFVLKQTDGGSELLGNNEIYALFDRKSLCFLMLLPASPSDLLLLLDNRFPSCSESYYKFI